MKFSTKWFRLDSFWNRILLCSVLLLSAAWSYYDDFTGLFPAFVLALILTLEIMGMLCSGYFILAKKIQFPQVQFWSFVSVFTLLRFSMVYFILQHRLPEWTVFHYPERSIFFLFFTSAAFIFLGYAYAVYEWGLAARKEYKLVMAEKNFSLKHPITIRCEGRTLHLLPQDVYFLQANGEYINYNTSHGKYMNFQRMKIAQIDLKRHGFIRVHRSYIVNPYQIKSFSNTEIELKTGKLVPVSKTYQKNLSVIGLNPSWKIAIRQVIE